MKKTFALLLFGAGSLLSNLSGAPLVSETSVQPYFAPPEQLLGRDIWNNVNIDRYPEQLREIAKEPMTQASYKRVKMPLLQNFFENPPPDNTRLMIREIEIYSGGKNIARSAKVSATTPVGEIRYPERVHDEDDSRSSTSYSAPARMKTNQPGTYTFVFDKPRTIESVVVKSGRERSEENNTYVHLAADFSIQVRDASGAWKDIPGAAVKANFDPNKKVVFAPVSVKELSVNITAQSTLMKRTPKTFTKYQMPKDVPFQISNHVSRPPFGCFEESILENEDLALYHQWKAAHPNFIGFYIAEWDNDIAGFSWQWKNLPKYFPTCSPAVIAKLQKIADAMRTREGYLPALKTYFDAISEASFRDPAKLNFIDCGRALSHYAQEWGAKYCLMETTCNGYQRHQPQMYFTRGAARQYGNQWGWYIAPTLLSQPPKGFSIGYTDPNFLKSGGLDAAGGNGGFSPSMNMRDRYLAWFAGATTVFNEGWPHAYCMESGTKNLWKLSPHGEVMKEWFSFLTKNPERGVSYAPIAIGMQWDHGVSPINGSRPFAGHLPNMRGDMMNEAVLRTFVPYKFKLDDQDWGMSETPYGDICDVILPSPPSGPVGMNVLKNYRVLFLSGTFNPDEKFAARLKEYVKNGGTLVVNVKQFGKTLKSEFTGVRLSGTDFKAVSPILTADGKTAFTLARPYNFEKIELAGARGILFDSAKNVMIALHKYGKGNVIVTTPDHLVHAEKAPMNQNFYSVWGRDLRFPFMDWLFGQFADELLPVRVSGHIQYGVNILKDGLLVYLFNNEGVKKTAFTAQTIDESKKVEVKIDLKDLKVSAVREIRCGKDLAVGKDNTVAITVPAGDIRVIKIKYLNRNV